MNNDHGDWGCRRGGGGGGGGSKIALLADDVRLSGTVPRKSLITRFWNEHKSIVRNTAGVFR